MARLGGSTTTATGIQRRCIFRLGKRSHPSGRSQAFTVREPHMELSLSARCLMARIRTPGLTTRWSADLVGALGSQIHSGTILFSIPLHGRSLQTVIILATRRALELFNTILVPTTAALCLRR